MSRERAEVLRSIIASPGSPLTEVIGKSFAIREWTLPGPWWLHIHRSDDEACHVLEGKLPFRFADLEVDVGPGTTVFVPGGVAHAYTTLEPCRYLAVLAPTMHRLMESLPDSDDARYLRETLAEFDTVFGDHA